MRFILLTILLLNPTFKKAFGQSSNILKSDCNQINISSKTNKPDFRDYLLGVKYAVVIWDGFNKNIKYLAIQRALFRYLKAVGFEYVTTLEEWGKYTNIPKNNVCETTFVDIDFEYSEYNASVYNDDFVEKIMITFMSCNNDFWNLQSSNQRVNAPSSEKLENGMYNAFVGAYNKSNGGLFSSVYTLKQESYQTCWSEISLKDSYSNNNNLEIEGIYENSSNAGNRYRLALKQINDKTYLIYLSGALVNSDNWKEGEIKAELEPTSTQYFYKTKWYNADKSVSEDSYISFENGAFTIVSKDMKETYIKMFPSFNDSKSKNYTSSGTGFAISSKGYIATNYHVTQTSKNIKIRGIRGDYSKAYNCTIIVEDKNNDLAIIKIDDPAFVSLGEVPFTIANKTSEVGTSIFVLGYPLLQAMGNEIKLTNGIISAKSGFQGDVTTYQISAPIQPGNSGGPLFNDKGNLIGIVNAKLKGAENASYAIKSSYLLNLIDLIPNSPKLQSQNFTSNKSLSEQVKVLKNFTYIIEVN